MEDTLREILDVTTGWSRVLSDDEKLATIHALAEDALLKQHIRSQRLKQMTREAQKSGLYDE